jgi:hypothetical protein
MSTEQDRELARELFLSATGWTEADIAIFRLEVDKHVDTMVGLLATHRTTREAELEALFTLQQTRMAEATSAWQQTTGETGLPDLGRLLTWLLEQRRELIAEVERAYQMLEVHGVPRGRARTVANGIDVLFTRFSREINDTRTQAARLGKALKLSIAGDCPPGSGEEWKSCAEEQTDCHDCWALWLDALSEEREEKEGEG